MPLVDRTSGELTLSYKIMTKLFMFIKVTTLRSILLDASMYVIWVGGNSIFNYVLYGIM
jgi:hypothetical protein